MKNYFLSFIISFFLFSCNQQNENSVKIDLSGKNLNDTLRIIKDLEGIYTNDGTIKSFISCDNPELKHLIENNSNQIDTLYKSILPHAYKGEGIYLQIKAEVNSSQDKNFADLLIVKEFKKAEQKSYKNTCIPYDFWCMGNEPFWQLQISEKENLIDFYDPMEQKTIHFNYSKAVMTNSITINSASDKTLKNKISISIKNEKCSDGMSDKQYNYKVEITLNDKKLNGCAVKFGEKI
jgi:uncharacterized membrane protein